MSSALDSSLSQAVTRPLPLPRQQLDTAFGSPRDFLNNRFVYVVLSSRARGLSVGVNMNPDKYCNFDCCYCEVNRAIPPSDTSLDTELMAAELLQTLTLIHEGKLPEVWRCTAVPPELLQLRHVALSGDGEPTLCPDFAEAVQAVVHVRALGRVPFFKLVLITNSTGLDLPQVQYGLKFFTKQDEIWAKLEAGTQAYMDKVNGSQVPIEKVMANILQLGRERPIIIQGLFPLIHGVEPDQKEIDEYAQRVKELSDAGAKISLVQIYSATRPSPHSEFSHLPLRSLSRIAQTVRQVTGLKVEVF
ncbi:MAG: hypothetical protein AB1813_09375 [Verrucomicrobiota bacterium]|jgi:wyosine [tRNA(Phe)-imidazoG37] synthetase (radical SAM superfamily)